MLKHAIAIAVLAALIGGCTDADWDRTLTKIGMGDEPSEPFQVQTAAAPSPAPPAAPDEFCEMAANSAAKEAREQGFDEATQRRSALTARAHCLHH